MNLLFVSSYSDLGGGETALLALARSLDPTQFEPHLLVPREGQLSQRWRDSGWRVHVTPWRAVSVYFVPAIWAGLPASRRMERIIRDNQIEALHAEYHSLPLALPAAERAGIPALWTCMGWWFKPKAWQRAFFQRPAAAFAHSEAIKTGFLGQPPFMPPAKMAVMYPGVDTRRFQPGVDGSRLRTELKLAPETPLVALVARFQAVKGHDVFQAMARQVAQAIPEAHFIVAGENAQTPADTRLRDLLLDTARQDALLRDRLHYLGFRPDVEAVIGAADVVVCSSRFEGYGVANIEAMACGRPVVSTNRGGPAETIVDGETGYLVPPGDPAALAQRVIQLLRDPARRRELGAAGRARVETQFAARANAAQFTQVLEELR